MSDAPLGRLEFLAALEEGQACLRAKLPRLSALEGAGEILVYSYGTRGKDLALQLRAADIRCVIYDNGPAARERAAADGGDKVEATGPTSQAINGGPAPGERGGGWRRQGAE